MAERLDNRPEWEHGGALKGAGAGPLSDEAKARIWMAIETGIAGPAPRRFHLPALVPAAAALVVMLVAAAAFYLVYRSRIAPPTPGAVIAEGPSKGAPAFAWTDASGAPIAAGGEVTAPAGSPRRLSLGARATAMLGGGAVVEAKSGEVAAEVRSGAVDFEVNKIEGAPPFSVEAQGVRVTVLGTAFRVDVRGREVSVQVHRGSVAVRTAAATHTLNAGESWSSSADVGAPQAPVIPDLSAKEPRPATPRTTEEKAPMKHKGAGQALKAPEDRVAEDLEGDRHEKAKEQIKDLKDEKKGASPEEKREIREKVKDAKEDLKNQKDDDAVKNGRNRHDRGDDTDKDKEKEKKEKKNRKHKDHGKRKKPKDKKGD